MKLYGLFGYTYVRAYVLTYVCLRTYVRMYVCVCMYVFHILMYADDVLFPVCFVICLFALITITLSLRLSHAWPLPVCCVVH